jgi:hypothetical protein
MFDHSAWYVKNRDRILAQQKEYKATLDPDAVRKYQREYARGEKRKTTRAIYLATSEGKAKHTESTNRWHKDPHNKLKLRKMYRKQDLKRHYNLTVEEWNELFDAQGKCCAICKSAHPGNKRGHWNTDHDHATGKVRGILCTHCNVMLGQARDNPDWLLEGAKYLEERIRTTPAIKLEQVKSR